MVRADDRFGGSATIDRRRAAGTNGAENVPRNPMTAEWMTTGGGHRPPRSRKVAGDLSDTDGVCTVFLVVDHAVFRSGSAPNWPGENGLSIAGEAGTVPESIDRIVASRPDVVLLDAHMPGGGGVAVLRGVRDRLGEDAPVFLALRLRRRRDVIATIRAGARLRHQNHRRRRTGRRGRRSPTATPCSAHAWLGFVLDSGSPADPRSPDPPRPRTRISADPPRDGVLLRLLARG